MSTMRYSILSCCCVMLCDAVWYGDMQYGSATFLCPVPSHKSWSGCLSATAQLAMWPELSRFRSVDMAEIPPRLHTSRFQVSLHMSSCLTPLQIVSANCEPSADAAWCHQHVKTVAKMRHNLISLISQWQPMSAMEKHIIITIYKNK